MGSQLLVVQGHLRVTLLTLMHIILWVQGGVKGSLMKGGKFRKLGDYKFLRTERVKLGELEVNKISKMFGNWSKFSLKSNQQPYKVCFAHMARVSKFQ